MTHNPRYYSRKIDLGELLRNDTNENKKKFDLTGVFQNPTPIKKINISEKELFRKNDPHSITREHVKGYRSPKEYAAIISMIIASVYLILISFFPLVYNFTSSFEPIDFLKNLLYFIAGLGTMAGVFNYLQKDTYLSHIADDIFERVIYQRLEPVLKDIAQVQVGINGVQDQIEMMNINIGSLANKKTPASTVIPNQMTYYIKYIVLINISLAVFLFMLQFPFGYIPYIVTILFILWWIIITAEYKLWNVEIAWTWVFFPIILLPMYTILMNAYLEDYQLFGSLSLGLCIYIISYYSWCSYIVKGVLPFDLQDVILNIAKENPGKRISIIEKIRYPRLNLKLNEISLHKIAMGLILVSIALFAITWFGYAIQHGMIPNIKWETMGLEGFEWRSSNTYLVNLFGIFLMLLGYKMLKPVKT